jgi:hypothetical protein
MKLKYSGNAMAMNPTRDSSVVAPTAVLVIGPIAEPVLCPFFRNCDGLLLFDSLQGSREFYPRDRSGAKSLCELILELRPERLICGFIDQPLLQLLRAGGVDVRLGSCACSVDDLVSSFSVLPKP